MNKCFGKCSCALSMITVFNVIKGKILILIHCIRLQFFSLQFHEVVFAEAVFFQTLKMFKQQPVSGCIWKLMCESPFPAHFLLYYFFSSLSAGSFSCAFEGQFVIQLHCFDLSMCSWLFHCSDPLITVQKPISNSYSSSPMHT